MPVIIVTCMPRSPENLIIQQIELVAHGPAYYIGTWAPKLQNSR